jgi:hypothetical protein
MHAFEYPTVLYNISSKMGNNFFIISLNTGFKAIINLLSGIYTSTNTSTLATAIVGPTSAIAAATSSSNILIQILNHIYLIANLSSTDAESKRQLLGLKIFINAGNQVTIVSSLSTPVPFTLNFQSTNSGYDDPAINLQTQIGWMLGYRKGVYTGLSSYTTEGNIDLLYPKYIYLYVDDYNKNVNANLFNCMLKDSLVTNNILSRITPSAMPTNVTQNMYLNGMVPQSTFRAYWGSVKISKLHIQLLDEFGRNVDTQNMDFSFVLALDIQRA